MSDDLHQPKFMQPPGPPREVSTAGRERKRDDCYTLEVLRCRKAPLAVEQTLLLQLLAEGGQACGEVAQGVARVDAMTIEPEAGGWLQVGLDIDQDFGPHFMV